MHSPFFQRSINTGASLTSAQPSRVLPRSSMTVRSHLNLDDLCRTASKLEDRIISTLVERTIYSYNRSLYNMHNSLDHENEGGMLRMMVSKIEHSQAAFDSFKVPEEVPFFPNNLPEGWSDPNAAVGSSPLILDPVAASLNMNSKIWSQYQICILNSMELKVGNDGRQGSALTCDASCIQLISKRVHWGKYLAEAKFQMSPDKFKEAVKTQHIQLLNNALACHEHRDAATKRCIIEDEQRTRAAKVFLRFVLPLAEEMEREYIVVKLSKLT